MALHTPELLAIIFAFAENKCQTALSARVCKLWSEIALNFLWRDVEQLSHLFGLLAPVRNGSAGCIFESIPTLKSWIRFAHYSHRVRSITYDGTVEDISGTTFEEVAGTRNTWKILPNLRFIKWVCAHPESLAAPIMFMHEGVVEFTFTIPECDSHPDGIFKTIAERMPFLEHLDFRSEVPISDCIDLLLDLLRSLLCLKTVSLPDCYMTSEVTEALSKLVHLHKVTFDMQELDGGDKYDVSEFQPNISGSDFPALRSLSLSVPLDHFQAFLNSSFRPALLQDLYVQEITWASKTTIHDFLHLVSIHCPVLSQLELCTRLPSKFFETSMTPTVETISFETIQPVLACPNLKTFRITHDYPLDLTEEELEKVARALVKLESVTLNPEPRIIPDSPHPSLNAVLAFLRHCPNIKKISMYIDATTIPSPPLFSDPSPHPNLKTLWFGLSPIFDPGAVASFLAPYCPTTCELSTYVEFAASLLNMDGMDRKKKWDDVKRMLGWCTKFVQLERMKRSILELEIRKVRLDSEIRGLAEVVQK
ncbi:hypothetical protein JAAARDRAFT_192345 [Jaapia argillacea MUCL 33604]|uniref:F-box domain-containing protein n=1 Tax=Jaapia argillacea MUCL 33604 TaxID=933084 RepID=A0A067Q8Q6_9AGAM|nr:hypothetical protein JAAARDRAFT_192345 [Jaapia argillacea MUCL 33604]